MTFSAPNQQRSCNLNKYSSDLSLSTFLLANCLSLIYMISSAPNSGAACVMGLNKPFSPVGMEYILTLWADGSAVGLVDLLTSLRKLCLFYPLFSLFWKREVGGQGPPIPLAYHIIYHIISQSFSPSVPWSLSPEVPQSFYPSILQSLKGDLFSSERDLKN